MITGIPNIFDDENISTTNMKIFQECFHSAPTISSNHQNNYDYCGDGLRFYMDEVYDDEPKSKNGFNNGDLIVDIFNDIDKAFNQILVSGMHVLPDYTNKNNSREINRYAVLNLIFECVHIYCDMKNENHFNLYKKIVEIESKSDFLSDLDFRWEIRCTIFNDKYEDLFSTIRVLKGENEPPSSYKYQLLELLKIT